MKRIIKTISYSFLAISSIIIFNACNKNNDSSANSTFEVSFIHDGAKIVKQVAEGGSVSIDEIGLPQAREHYIASWDLNGISLDNISSNLTINAKYVPVNYEVKWLDYDDSELEIDITPYNSIPSFDSDDPIREKDAQYEYEFSGWDKDITKPIEGNTIFKAQYLATVRKYLVSFSDGESIIKTKQYEYGQIPSFDGTPLKDADEQYSYSFANWDKQFVEVTQNVTYTALWNQTLNEYSVKFVDGDNNDSVIIEQTLPYGTPIESPVFPAPSQGYHYEWDKDIDETVTKDVTYTRSYKPNTDTPYKVEIYSPKYVASVGDNQKFKEESLEMVDITSDFKDLLQLDDNNYGKGTTDTIPNFAILDNLPDIFELDESNSSYNIEISGDGSSVYKFTYNINWSSLGFSLDDLVSGYLLGGYNHSGSYICLGRAYVENEDNSIAGLKVHYDFENKTGNGSNFAITINHLDVNMYESISVRYGAFTANTEGSYWASRMAVKGENDDTPEINWPLSGHTYQNYEVRAFDAINQLSICPNLTHVDAIKFIYQAYGSISNMSEAGHTDYYILGLDIVEKSDNLTIRFNDGQQTLSTYRIANGSKVSSPSDPLKDGYFFTGWYQEDLTTLFDFNEALTEDTIIYAKFEEAVQYKVSIETEYYTRDGSANGTFEFPSIKQYHDATNEFATDLGLSYDSNGNFYYAYGKLGTIPDFEILSNLPEIYHLEGTIPTDTISNDIVTYSFKYSIDEEVLGYPLNKIHISYAYDETIYEIGLFKDKTKAGFMVKIEQGMKRAYSTPISIIFDDLEVSLYEQISISGTAKFKSTSRNIKWYVNGELKTYKDDSLVATWINQSYTNFNVDALAVMESTGQQILKQIDARPATAPDNNNSLNLCIDKIVVKEKSDNHIVTFKDQDTTLSVKVPNGGSVVAPNWTKTGFILSWDRALTNITEDVIINAIWEKNELEALYTVNVYLQTIDFGTDNINDGEYRIATNPNISYVLSTDMFTNLLSLNESYKASGEIGKSPSFDAIDNLKFFKLNSSKSNADELISNDGSTVYNLYYDIDEDEFGFALSDISLRYYQYRVAQAKISLDYNGVKFYYNLDCPGQGQFFDHTIVFDINENVYSLNTFKITYIAHKENANSVTNKINVTTNLGDSVQISNTVFDDEVTVDLLAQVQEGATTLNSFTIDAKCAFAYTANSSISYTITDVEVS